MSTKISAMQILRWTIAEKWESFPLRKKAIIFWAFAKLYLALKFIKNEFHSFLNLDASALMLMSPARRDQYQVLLCKIRNKIGNHGSFLYTTKKFWKDIRSSPKEFGIYS